ncbi:hypothetical protein [Arenimonas fontis]|uniref:Uncharacterized protein n=1 Tax=Arenimonas fontis TaxID=2608255 RepID=A0A5B2Z8I4_9GAMM|nr:hypothetical protein [Arenimonas fontis]KAA2284185.1 hypothetical protein F0415_10580 [Arenimonas fontis]
MSTQSICFAGLSREEEAQVVSQFKQANGRLGNAWVLAPEAEAEVVVIDMDSMYGQMSLMKAIGSGKRVVALTAGNRADADHLLQRPVSAEGIERMLSELAGTMAAAPAAAQAPARAASDDPAPAEPPAPPPVQTAAPAPGPAPAAAPEPAPEPRLFDHLRPGALSGPVRLRLAGAPDLVIDPGRQVYFGGTALKPLLPYCTAVLPPESLAPVSPAELPGLEAQAGGAQPLSRLIWLCALASGNGALMPGFSPNDRYKLLKWPQTEREFPKHFRIATVMMKGPALLTDIAGQSGASLAEVIDFVNASLVAGVATPESAAGNESEPAKAGGLLARFRR